LDDIAEDESLSVLFFFPSFSVVGSLVAADIKANVFKEYIANYFLHTLEIPYPDFTFETDAYGNQPVPGRDFEEHNVVSINALNQRPEEKPTLDHVSSGRGVSRSNFCRHTQLN